MASTTMPPIPHKSPIVDEGGLLTLAWAGFFRELFKRIGGNIAPPNSDITSVSNTVSGQGTSLTSLQAQVNSLQNQVGGLTKGRDL